MGKRAKLTEENVREIRQTHDPANGITDRFFANKFGMSISGIRQARQGSTWSNTEWSGL